MYAADVDKCLPTMLKSTDENARLVWHSLPENKPKRSPTGCFLPLSPQNIMPGMCLQIMFTASSKVVFQFLPEDVVKAPC